nr:RHS repeat-associated core domain-containing protein [Pseudomonas sp. PB120]
MLAADIKNSVLGEVTGEINRIVYSAYGHRSAQHTVTARLGFNGELCESRMGWYLLGNGYRAYNPRLKRFHSPDSLSPFEQGGLNAYMYCGGEPVMNKDPTGHNFFAALGTHLRAMKNNFLGAYQVQRAAGQNPVTALVSTVSGNGGLPNGLGLTNGSALQPGAQPKPITALPSAKKGGLHHNVVGGSSTPGSEASYNGSGLGSTGNMWDRLAARDRSTQVAVVSPNYGRSTQTAVVKPSQSAPAPRAAATPSAPPTVRNGAAIQPSRPEPRWDTGSRWSGESGPSDWSSSSSNSSIRRNRQ